MISSVNARLATARGDITTFVSWLLTDQTDNTVYRPSSRIQLLMKAAELMIVEKRSDGTAI
jgi:hypothetical protein